MNFKQCLESIQDSVLMIDGTYKDGGKYLMIPAIKLGADKVTPLDVNASKVNIAELEPLADEAGYEIRVSDEKAECKKTDNQFLLLQETKPELTDDDLVYTIFISQKRDSVKSFFGDE